MTERKKILAVDDEEPILEILSFNLEGEGYIVDTSLSAEEAMRKNLHSYDLFILDVMMGHMSGFRLAEKIRKEHGLPTPIIFLTARDTENDRITGFNLGADDYLAKPFSVRELIARVKAILRRSAPARMTMETVAGSFTLDTENNLIFSEGKPLDLTRKEYDILSLLIHAQKDEISQSEERFHGIWDHIQAGIILVDPQTRTIMAANPEAERITGYSEEQMKGQKCHRFICPAEEGNCPVCDKGQTVDRADRIVLTRDGKEIHVLKTVTDLSIGGKRCLVESFIDLATGKKI